jgi:hypothetical protein
MGHLIEYDVPTFYVSKELLAAASRTELPMDKRLDAIPIPVSGIDPEHYRPFSLPVGILN